MRQLCRILVEHFAEYTLGMDWMFDVFGIRCVRQISRILGYNAEHSAEYTQEMDWIIVYSAGYSAGQLNILLRNVLSNIFNSIKKLSSCLMTWKNVQMFNLFIFWSLFWPFIDILWFSHKIHVSINVLPQIRRYNIGPWGSLVSRWKYYALYRTWHCTYLLFCNVQVLIKRVKMMPTESSYSVW